MSLLLSFIAGAVFALVVVQVLRRGAGAGEPPGLSELRDAVQRLALTQEGSRSETSEQLRSLLTSQGEVLRHTGQLSQALTRPGIRGQWGELTLVNVCEAAGMAQHIDFDTQAHVRRGADDDAAARPDLVIHLPGGGHVCVDAKVPLEAFRDAVAADDTASKADALGRHVQQVRSKVRQLSGKAYWDRFERTPEMVVMFIPSEAAFAAAVQHDPTLIENAAREKVVIATPATMLALLQVVGLGWREHALSQNTEEIRLLAAQLVKRIGMLSRHLAGVGKALEAATRAHNSAVRSYDGRLLVTARRLADLGLPEAAALDAPMHVESVPQLPADTAPVMDGPPLDRTSQFPSGSAGAFGVAAVEESEPE